MIMSSFYVIHGWRNLIHGWKCPLWMSSMDGATSSVDDIHGWRWQMVEMDGPKDCNFDGEDCCGSNVNTQFCSKCQCLRYEATPSDKTSAITRLFTILIISISTTTSISFRETCPDRQDWIGDGYCHDGLNTEGSSSLYFQLKSAIEPGNKIHGSTFLWLFFKIFCLV